MYPAATVYPIAPATPAVPTEVTNASGAVTFGSSNGTFAYEGSDTLAASMVFDPTGACSIAPVGTAGTFTIQALQSSAGAGKRLVCSGSVGASGQAGGITQVGSNNGALPGTDLAGGAQIEHGATVGGYSAKCSHTVGGVEFCSFRKHASFAGGAFEGVGLTAFMGSAGVWLASIDGSTILWLSQSDFGATFVGKFVEVGGQLSSAWDVVAVGAAPAINCTLGNNHRIGSAVGTKNTSNATIPAPTTPRDAVHIVRIVSNGVNTIAWNAIFKFGAAATSNADQWALGPPADGKITTHAFLYNGTDAWECLYSSVI